MSNVSNRPARSGGAGDDSSQPELPTQVLRQRLPYRPSPGPRPKLGLRPFTNEVFLAQVQRHLRVHDLEQAITASVAVLETVARSLDPAERTALARRLPPGLCTQIPTLAEHAERPVRFGQHAVTVDD